MAALRPFLDRVGRFRQWPSKRRLQDAALERLIEVFERGVFYSERQVNTVLDHWATFGDPVRLRRGLVDLGLLERKPDGSAYWRRDQ